MSPSPPTAEEMHVDDGAAIAVAIRTCVHCGYTQLFNAKVLGLIEN